MTVRIEEDQVRNNQNLFVEKHTIGYEMTKLGTK